ncbi:hypothetical protein SAY87_009223 [Trapa incisa]|uniref:Late embryogenesis abundant protein LEA-2 subgroup domain-containing protein n=2 Tax=Trapa TaxID=22665 RepID=A0AAN7MNG1_TRANT|nr:hypothetical protein SAY87_009223 [Trapa incisa]KAK4798490.1 hypothetical protein SAY86_030816 [Trapa natans]
MEEEKQNLPEGQKAALRRRRRWLTCCGATVAALIGVALVAVILAFTVFKPKQPVTTVDSVGIKDLAISVDLLRLRLDINVTLDVGVSVKNPNKVSFRYKNSSALLSYRGREVGEAPIPADKISAGETKPMNLTMTLLADRLLTDSHLYSDVISGQVPLSTSWKISGRVKALKIFPIHVVSAASCELTLFVAKRTVGNQRCEYKTEL